MTVHVKVGNLRASALAWFAMCEVVAIFGGVSESERETFVDWASARPRLMPLVEDVSGEETASVVRLGVEEAEPLNVSTFPGDEA